MKTIRFWKFGLLLLVPVALYFYIAERNSWRPKTLVLGIFPRDIQFSPDNRTLIVEDQSSEFRDDLILCDARSATPRGHIEMAEYPCFVDAGKYVAAFCSSERFEPREQRVKIFSVPDAKMAMSGPKNFIPVGVLADESTLIGFMATGEFDSNKLFQWNWRADKAPRFYRRLPKTSLNMPWLLPDKATLTDGAHFWDLATGKLRFEIKRSADIPPPRFRTPGSASASLMAFLEGEDKAVKVQVWNYKTGKRQSSVTLLSGPFSGLVLSPDNTMLAGAPGEMGSKSEVRLWDIKDGQTLRQLKVPQDDTYRLAFSPDSRTLAAIGSEGTIHLWRIK